MGKAGRAYQAAGKVHVKAEEGNLRRAWRRETHRGGVQSLECHTPVESVLSLHGPLALVHLEDSPSDNPQPLHPSLTLLLSPCLSWEHLPLPRGQT